MFYADLVYHVLKRCWPLQTMGVSGILLRLCFGWKLLRGRALQVLGVSFWCRVFELQVSGVAGASVELLAEASNGTWTSTFKPPNPKRNEP